MISDYDYNLLNGFLLHYGLDIADSQSAQEWYYNYLGLNVGDLNSFDYFESEKRYLKCNCIWKIFKIEKGFKNLAERVYYTLRKLGTPCHYSFITEIHNIFFQDNQKDENSIHSSLISDRKSFGFVNVGIMGTYGLKEWGIEKPEPYFKSIYRIVLNEYKRTKKSVSFNYISAELCKKRKIYNKNSIFCAIGFCPFIVCVGQQKYIPRESKNENEKIEEEEIDMILREFERKDFNPPDL